MVCWFRLRTRAFLTEWRRDTFQDGPRRRIVHISFANVFEKRPHVVNGRWNRNWFPVCLKDRSWERVFVRRLIGRSPCWRPMLTAIRS